MLDSMAEDATVAGPTRSGRAVVAPGAAADPASAASPSTAPRDVIFSFCFTTLEGAERRGMHYPPERLVLALLEHPRVRRLLIVDPFRSLPVEIVRRALRRDGRGMRLPAHATRHRPLRLGRTDPTGIEALERLYAGFDRRLRRAASAAGFERPAVITANPHVAAYSPLEWADRVTAYIWDDWAAHPEFEPWRPALLDGYDRMRARGRVFTAVSQEIVDRARPSGPAAVIANGIDPEEWLEPGAPPAWFTALRGPRLLYVGTLDGRLDVDLVRECAERFSDGSVVLVGLSADPSHLAALEKLPNVHLHPPVGRRDVAALVRAADVCLVPHARTRLTRAMSPLKLFEYVAAGRPVAAVDLDPIRGVHPSVQLVGVNDSFADAVEAALALGPLPEDERLQFLGQNSWQARFDEMIELALG
jgi:teichuronic acid biosynthesis glycosyltransferase TuaH